MKLPQPITKLSFLAAGTAVALGSALGTPASAATLQVDKLFVFGDSLVDTGNIFGFSGGTFPPSSDLLYYQGRFSNGPNWVDYLAQDLQVTPTPIASVLLNQTVPTQGINYGFGGATTGNGNTLRENFPPFVQPFIPGLAGQVQAFLASGPADPNALYILTAGGNDYLPTESTTFTPFTSPTQTLTNIATALGALAGAGAKNFLVANLPDLGFVPVGASDRDRLNQLTAAHNAGLATVLNGLEQTNPGVNIFSLDLNGLVQDVRQNPGQFGFTNTTDPCFNPQTLNLCGFTRQQQNQYLFWDPIHPTTAAQRLIADRAKASLSVPEPTTVAGLFVAGGMGYLARRRRKQAA